jgi:hypothetical protein
MISLKNVSASAVGAAADCWWPTQVLHSANIRSFALDGVISSPSAQQRKKRGRPSWTQGMATAQAVADLPVRRRSEGH